MTIKIFVTFEDTKILEFNQYQKFDKAPFIIYADLECIIGKIDGCKNNSENNSKDGMKKFCEFLREHAMKIINFKNKKMKL